MFYLFRQAEARKFFASGRKIAGGELDSLSNVSDVHEQVRSVNTFGDGVQTVPGRLQHARVVRDELVDDATEELRHEAARRSEEVMKRKTGCCMCLLKVYSLDQFGFRLLAIPTQQQDGRTPQLFRRQTPQKFRHNISHSFVVGDGEQHFLAIRQLLRFRFRSDLRCDRPEEGWKDSVQVATESIAGDARDESEGARVDGRSRQLWNEIRKHHTTPLSHHLKKSVQSMSTPENVNGKNNVNDIAFIHTDAIFCSLLVFVFQHFQQFRYDVVKCTCTYVGVQVHERLCGCNTH